MPGLDLYWVWSDRVSTTPTMRGVVKTCVGLELSIFKKWLCYYGENHNMFIMRNSILLLSVKVFMFLIPLRSIYCVRAFMSRWISMESSWVLWGVWSVHLSLLSETCGIINLRSGIHVHGMYNRLSFLQSEFDFWLLWNTSIYQLNVLTYSRMLTTW